MEFKGTKGKWRINGEKYFTIDSIGSSEPQSIGIKTIATVNSSFMTTEESKANAVVMGKSKEMLELLKEIERAYQMYSGNIPFSTFEKTEKLIKEATELK
ncbi:hypothetical protein MP478_04445 [Chryseobacterium sp. WG14]|uniref:hypothetical protein n=1 Tax=Chryseobacterium sp. WG14 TaxID=2926909 RepID=UPI00211F1C7B|nr:hypothetical protein [Chryseobacterium sp. WG14]MCQ9638630.1 hypothetical protein [Chryseobacterium sp. WG14]